MAILKWFLIVGVVGWGGLCALLYVAQRKLMYFPETIRTAPALAGLPQAEEVVLDTADGEKIIVWHVPPQGDKPVVLYFHGNGGALRNRAERFKALVADGTGLIALSYRGYGGSTGSPSETGLIADAGAAYAFAAARYPPARITLWGESLGTGVAVALAAERPVAGLVLEAPFTSAVEVGAAAYPFMPVRLLMSDRFPSDERIGNVAAPILVMHGERDRVVPIRYAEALFARAREPKRFVRFPDGGHNDLDAHGALAAVRNFLSDDATAPVTR